MDRVRLAREDVLDMPEFLGFRWIVFVIGVVGKVVGAACPAVRQLGWPRWGSSSTSKRAGSCFAGDRRHE